MEDQEYLKQKRIFEIEQQIIDCEKRKNLYLYFYDMMVSQQLKYAQERFLIANIEKTITFFQLEIQTLLIKKRDLTS